MYSAWFRSTFLRVLKFLQIKEGGPNFWREPILQKVWTIWSLLLYLNFKSLVDPNSSSFIRFQCTLHDSGVLFSEVWNFYKLKKGDLISGGEPILEKGLIIWSPFLYFNFKSFTDPNSSSFIRFQCILHDWGVLFSESLNFYKLKKGDLISGGNQFCRKSELFGPPFYISILKVLRTQILCHSFFMWKVQPPWKKALPSFPVTPSKSWDPVKPHPFLFEISF